MKTKLQSSLFLAFLMLFVPLISIKAQTASPYKITNIQLVPFDGQTGKFQEEIKPNDSRSFFNEIALSLFVTVEVSGTSGSFEAGRVVEVTVHEGKKQKAKKTEQVGLIGEEGKFYVPLWLDSGLCSEITIKARLIGQKTASSMTRKASFQCGE